MTTKREIRLVVDGNDVREISLAIDRAAHDEWDRAVLGCLKEQIQQEWNRHQKTSNSDWLEAQFKYFESYEYESRILDKVQAKDDDQYLDTMVEAVEANTHYRLMVEFLEQNPEYVTMLERRLQCVLERTHEAGAIVVTTYIYALAEVTPNANL